MAQSLFWLGADDVGKQDAAALKLSCLFYLEPTHPESTALMARDG